MTTVTKMVIVHGDPGVELTEALESSGLMPSVGDGVSVVWLPRAPEEAPEDRAAPAEPRLLLDANMAAARLGVSRSTVYRLVEAGQLAMVHVGRSARIPAVELDDYVNRLSARDRSGE